MANLFSTSLSDAKPWFLSLIDQAREYRQPASQVQVTAAPVEVPELWSRHKAVVPRIVSLMVHLTMVALALTPWVKAPAQFPKGLTNITFYAPTRLVLPMDKESGGGGGGGRHQPNPASLGKLPRAADRQMVPPSPETPKNLDPTLIVEPTIVAPQLANLPQLALLPIGDPNGIPGPPSSGPGDGDGIGIGDGRGIGNRTGPGTRDGDGGGCCSGAFSPGGGVSTPVLITEIMPEYSEEARKARYQGTVVLDTIVMEDGSVRVRRVKQGLGFGLDEKAIAAVLKWKFKPGRKDGKAVAVTLFVEVNFNLR